MGWARLDDGFHDHPKVDELSLAAVGLWTLCLTWAHRHRKTSTVPGAISQRRVDKIAGDQAEELAGELVASGLWEVSALGGWLIHDFTDYQPRERDADEASAAGRRGAASRWQSDGKPMANSHATAMAVSHDVAIPDDGKQPPKAMADTHAPIVHDDMANDASRASARAFPSRPVPSRPKDTSGTRKRAQPAPDIFPITDAMAAWGRTHCPLVQDPPAETAKFLDHHRARGSSFKDWTAAWRTWMANAQTYTAERAGRGPRTDVPEHLRGLL